MKEACLNGFALLYVYRDLNINFNMSLINFHVKIVDWISNKLNFDTEHQ